MGLFGSLFSSNSSASNSTTQNSYDQRQAVGDNSVGLAPGASFSLINELPDGAVTLLSNFAEVIGEVASNSTRAVTTTAAQGNAAVNSLTTQVKASGAAIDIKAIAPYILGGGALVAIYMMFKKG